MRSDALRYCCQKLDVGKNGNTEKIWVKQLRHILETDIHKKELGCKCNTHIKIGNVHLNSFYESRILFSHNVWSNRFASWLRDRLKELNAQKIVFIGYEIDVEPIIFLLQNKLEKDQVCLRYGIYEEKKYTQNNGYAQTEENIRYFESIKKLLENTKNPEELRIVFFCGTSTTLSTFKKMREQLLKDFKKNEISNEKWNNTVANSSFYSLIQVLPIMGKTEKGVPFQSIYNAEDLCEITNNRITRRFTNENDCDDEEDDNNKEDDVIVSEYLVNITNQWYDAEICPLCFPLEQNGNDIFMEEPLIATSETSVVPFMMIRDLKHNSDTVSTNRNELKTNELLWNKNGYKYVYYDHIDRMDHHFKYYVRTAHLIKDIMDDVYPDKKELFKNRCYEIAKEINKTNKKKKTINIIVYPSSFGDEVFPLAINEHVFENKAYLLAVNPNKEFRSNFETKYSNLAYVLEQTESKTQIKFHYVAKQLLSIDTYTRIKSFIRSLMCRYTDNGLLPKNVELFSSVIVFLSRISNSSISDYIERDKFFHFIDIAIPSLRNYGDSCPICKRRQDVNSYIKASNLDICISHWSQKHDLYKPKSIENAIERWDKESDDLRSRKYNRFYCENKIWNSIKKLNCNDEDSYLQAFIEGMCDDKKYVDAESFIPCVKAISGPFLYYKEYAKNAALHLLLHSIEALRKMKPVGSINGAAVTVEVRNKKFSIHFLSIYQQYTTLVVLLNCLANMDSTYILNPEVIVNLCKFVENLSTADTVKITRAAVKESLLAFGKGNCLLLEENEETYYVEAFLSCVVYAFKRVICGTSGEAKSLYFSKYYDLDYDKVIFEESKSDSRISELFYVLFIENSSSCSKQEFDRGDIIDKYRKSLLSYLQKKITGRDDADKIKLLLAYKDPVFKHIYPLSGYNENQGVGVHAKSNYEKEFCNLFESKYKDCFESDKLDYCGWSRNEQNNVFVISLKFYSDDVSDRNDKIDGSEEKVMYLVVEFPSINDINETKEEKHKRIISNLMTVRMLLEDRYYLCQEIWSDIQNNSIRESIQAREAELLMAEGKNVAHNGSRDIREMLNLIKDELVKMNSVDEKQKNYHYSNACRMISVMMSYCIGRASNDNLLRSYYSRTPNESFFINDIQPLYCNNVLLDTLVTSTEVDEIEFIKRYFRDLINLNQNKASEYLRESLFQGYDCENKVESNEKKKLIGSVAIFVNKKQVKSAQDEETFNAIAEIFKSINTFPDIFKHNNLTTNTSAGSIFLVGFLDLFIMNVTKHAEGSDVTINIESGSDSYYNIRVENDYNPSVSSSPGITRLFFDLLNRMTTNDNKKAFEIRTNPSGDRSKYISEIIVYKKGG